MKTKGWLGSCSKRGKRNEPRSSLQRDELEDFVCAKFIEHDIMFLSELLRNMSVDIECSFCTSAFERFMAIRRDLIKELNKLAFRERKAGRMVKNVNSRRNVDNL